VRVVHEARTPKERERLRAVADATRLVRPPGIIRVIDIDDADDALRVTVEVPPGPALDEQPVERAAFATMATALAGLHALGVSHGDVRADAITVDPTGRPVLPLPRWRAGHAASIDDDVVALAALVREQGRTPTDAATIAGNLADEAPRLLAPASRRARVRGRHAPTTVAGTVAVVVGAFALVVAVAMPMTATSQPPPSPTAPAPTVAATTDRVVDIDGRRYVVGEPGDLVVTGAWDCGTAHTPAIVRPRTGDVLVFARVSPHATATHVTSLGPVIAAGRRTTTATTTCDELVVDTPDGPTTVELSRPTVGGAGRRPRSPAAAPQP
jgi:hypothetical protein